MNTHQQRKATAAAEKWDARSKLRGVAHYGDSKRPDWMSPAQKRKPTAYEKAFRRGEI